LRRPRIDLAPINTGMYLHGLPTEENLDFYRARSGRGIHTSIVGNIAVSSDWVPNSTTGFLSSSVEWSGLSSAIRSNGSVPGIQLSCTVPGCAPSRDFTAQNPDREFVRYFEAYSSITDSMWFRIESSFLSAIARCMELGFEHIQIHAAHGYLFSLALDPNIDVRNRGFRVLQAVLDRLSDETEVELSIRVSWLTGLQHDADRQSRMLSLWELYQSKFRLDISNGYYNIDKLRIYPPLRYGASQSFTSAAMLARKYPRSQFSVAGNVWNPMHISRVRPWNLAFAIGRPLIADPDHLSKIADGLAIECDDCGECHYFSRSQERLTCPKWNRAGRYCR
jgi:2,4-dienoyl-CoA reductase-like NADH-dependent reductase (Old Yellow Enzyme family)